MVRALIVARTKMSSRVCVGAISSTGQRLRLLNHLGHPQEANCPFQIGQVYDLNYRNVDLQRPPHVEDVCVTSFSYAGKEENLYEFLQQSVACAKSPGQLFEGFLRRTINGTLYIAEKTGIPAYSTAMWHSDRPLRHVLFRQRAKYSWLEGNSYASVPFVGFQEPVAEIPAGALVRLSLARWWRPEEQTELELRCYLQVSGWFWGRSNGQGSSSDSFSDVSP